MKKFIFLILSLSVLYACSDKNVSPLVGKWNDIIKLSQKEALISAEKDSILITTQGEWWWITSISINDSAYDFHEVNTTGNNFTIKGKDFKIERKNKTEIYILMFKNETGAERILKIGLEAGDYFDRIIVNQASN